MAQLISQSPADMNDILTEDVPKENQFNKSNEQISPSGEFNKMSNCEAEAAKVAREIEESEALARMLMAEEAQQSFSMQYEFMQSNTADMDTVDLVAVQRLLRQDEEATQQESDIADEGELSDIDNEEDEDGEDGDDGAGGDDTYDDLLELGRHIGDVKQERWKFRAQKVIDSLPLSVYHELHECCLSKDIMCIFCQDDYSKGDRIRKLPCEHSFHAECVDEWLALNDTCPMCKKEVEAEE